MLIAVLEVCHPEWTLNGKPDVEGWRAEFALWAVLASPIILGNDVRTISKECLEIVTNRDILAVHQDPAINPYRMVWQSLPHLLYGQDDVQQIFARRMTDGDEAVAFFNRFDTSARNISVHWEQLGIYPPWRPCTIRDLHSHTVLATAQQYRLTLSTPPHGVRALRFRCGEAAAGSPPGRPPPLPPPHSVAPPPPTPAPPPVLAFGLEVQPCGGGGGGSGFNASSQEFSWRETDGTLRLTSNTALCVTYLGQSMGNVGLAVCQTPKAWALPGIGAQVWNLSSSSSIATAAGSSSSSSSSSSFVYNACEPNGAADMSRCFNVVGCNASGHAFEVGSDCALPLEPPSAATRSVGGDSGGGCDQRWKFEGGVVRTGADGYLSCLTLGAPKNHVY